MSKMKTAEEIEPEVKHGLIFYQHEFKKETGKDYLVEAIRKIQLNAAQAAMELAAIVAYNYFGDGSKKSADCSDAILTASQNPDLLKELEK